MTILPKVDRDHPFNSLAQFTQGHCYLNDASKIAYFRSLKAVFAELASNHETRTVPEELQGRFQKPDLLNLYSLIHKDLFSNKRYEFAQLMASISQVADCKLAPIGDLGTYRIAVMDPLNPEKALYWGWIYRTYAHMSEALMQCIDPKGVIHLQNVSPHVLWTLQRFQEAKTENLLSRESEIPEVCAHALSEFFLQYGMKELEGAFKKWMGLSFNGAVREEDSPFDPQNPYRSLRRFVKGNALLKDCRHTFTRDFSQFFNQAAYENTRIPLSEKHQMRFVTIDLPFLLTIAPLAYATAEERLIAAIQRVSQLQFSSLVLVEHHFGDYPQDFEMRFLKPLKVELTTMAPLPLEMVVTHANPADFHQRDISVDGLTLVNLLCMASTLKLPSLKKMIVEDIIKALNTNASRREMNRILYEQFDRPEIQELLNEEKIFLFPPSEFRHPDHHFNLLLHNLRIAPTRPLKEILKVAFPDTPISKQLLRAVWDQVDTSRQKEFLDIFAHDIFSSFKPDLSLEQLQHFCSHLGLGIVSYVHTSALGLYRFLKQPHVRESFAHPEILQKILETFPTAYPELMAREELELWRQERDARFTGFFHRFTKLLDQCLNSNAWDLHAHLHKCCYSLITLEEMHKGIAYIFFHTHRFDVQAETFSHFSSMFEEGARLFREHAPQQLQRAYQFLSSQLNDFQNLIALYSRFEEMLKPYPIDDADPVNRLMNIVWVASRLSAHPAYASCKAAWDKPIPTDLQVEWLFLLTQLKDTLQLDHVIAAQILSQHRVAEERIENPELTLALCQLKQTMIDKKLPEKVIPILIHFRTLEKLDDAALLSELDAKLLEPQEKQAFTHFLHMPEITQSIALHAELESFRLRLLSILEPSMLSNSLLSLSQFFTWNK